MYESRSFAILFMVLVGLVPLGLIAGFSGPMDLQSVKIFTFLPEVWIHNFGVALAVVFFGAMIFGLARMYTMISKGIPKQQEGTSQGSGWSKELVTTVFKESLAQDRMAKCDSSTVTWKDRLKGRWFAHMAMMWGFLGLLASTMLRYIAFPTNGQTMPIYDPIRLLGTISGLLLVYGASSVIVSRMRKADTSTEHTHFTDWIFLVLLLLAGLTGFLLEGAGYASDPTLVYSALVVHMVVVFELLLMAPLSKFAHAFYRPFAIWISRTRHYI